jgi:site-specific DNA recombinase
MPPALLTGKPESGAQATATATAVIYLRVSSTGQLTGHSQEGYSIEGQREACERHAAGLGARVIRKYVEAGRSATNLRRPALRQMLAEMAELQPTYVIFYDLSRVARDEFDAFWLLREIEAAGAKLESTLERIDNDDTGMLLYTVMAGVNAHRSRRDGKKVKMGLERKFANGGTVGPALIGYLNVREHVNDKEVRSVGLDEDRYRLVQVAFEAFATGEHSISTLRNLLESLGLRTRPTPKRPAKPLSRNGVYRMLRNDYYTGIVTFKGVKGDGRHPAIIDRATFEKVQQVLDSHRLSGDRSKKHNHYLKGSLFCGNCGRRLLYGRHRGNGGVYEYFSCISHQGLKVSCGAHYVPIDTVERKIENLYRSVQLTAVQVEAVRRDIEGQVGARLEVARKQSDHHQRRLRTLQDEQQKLIQLHYRNLVSEEVLQAEQQRIETERGQARRWVESATHEASEVMEALKEALALVEYCHQVYLAAEPMVRRLMNQAIFERFLVHTDDLGGEQQPVLARIDRIGQTYGQLATAGAGRSQENQSPQFPGGFGSDVIQMVRRAGLEPAPPD